MAKIGLLELIFSCFRHLSWIQLKVAHLSLGIFFISSATREDSMNTYLIYGRTFIHVQLHIFCKFMDLEVGTHFTHRELLQCFPGGSSRYCLVKVICLLSVLCVLALKPPHCGLQQKVQNITPVHQNNTAGHRHAQHAKNTFSGVANLSSRFFRKDRCE